MEPGPLRARHHRPELNYLVDHNVALVSAAIDDPGLVADLDLAALRRVLTFLARAERHADGGWYDRASAS